MIAVSHRVTPSAGVALRSLSALLVVFVVVLGLVFAGSTAAAEGSMPASAPAVSSVDDPAAGASAAGAVRAETPHPLVHTDARHRSVSATLGALSAPAVSASAPASDGATGQPRSSAAPFVSRMLHLLLSINRT